MYITVFIHLNPNVTAHPSTAISDMLIVIFAVLDVSLAVNLCINCSFFTFIVDNSKQYIQLSLTSRTQHHNHSGRIQITYTKHRRSCGWNGKSSSRSETIHLSVRRKKTWNVQLWGSRGQRSSSNEAEKKIWRPGGGISLDPLGRVAILIFERVERLLSIINKKLSCCRETARCFVSSLNILLSHSRSLERLFEMKLLRRAWVPSILL